jgi:hypothetical protein
MRKGEKMFGPSKKELKAQMATLEQAVARLYTRQMELELSTTKRLEAMKSHLDEIDKEQKEFHKERRADRDNDLRDREENKKLNAEYIARNERHADQVERFLVAIEAAVKGG